MTTPGGHVLCYLVPTVTALLTFIVFLPSLRNEFVSWDDFHMFTHNPHYRGLGWTQLRWSWTTFHVGEYMPLTWMTYGADYALWGLNPMGYHLSNLLLHIVATLVVYFLGLRLLRLGATDPGEGSQWALCASAGMATLIFAMHPLRAEPVAWVSARGSILGGLWLLLSVLAYLNAFADLEPGQMRRRWFVGALGLFVLALLSRATNVMLPFVLLALDVYPLRRLGGGARRWFGPDVRHVWWEKLPFVALAIPVLPLAVLARTETEGVFGRISNDVMVSAAVALFGLAFYLGKTFLLGSSSPLNETPPDLNPLTWPFVLSGAVVLTVTFFLIMCRRRWPAPLTAWVCYATILIPTLGIIPFGMQMVADRYTYVSCVGWALLVGAGLLASRQAWREGRLGTPVWVLMVGGSAIAVAGLGALTWNQVQIWRDSKTLWTHVVSMEPRAAVARISLGLVLEREGNLAEAAAHLRQAAQIWPDDATVHTNLGRVLTRQRRLAEAVEHLRIAVRLRPTFADAHLTLGGALALEGRLHEAIGLYRTATRLRPGSAPIHYNLGRALAEVALLHEAIEHYEAALQLQPDFVEARTHLNLARQRLEERRRGRRV